MLDAAAGGGGGGAGGGGGRDGGGGDLDPFWIRIGSMPSVPCVNMFYCEALRIATVNEVKSVPNPESELV